MGDRKYFWSAAEDKILQTASSPEDAVKLLQDRTLYACRGRLHLLERGPKRKIKVWSEDEDSRLLKLRETYSRKECARLLKRTTSEIKRRIWRLKDKEKVRSIQVFGKRLSCKPWTRKDDAALVSLAMATSQKEAARKINRTPSAVSARIRKLGIQWQAGGTSAADLTRETGAHRNVVGQAIHDICPRHRYKRGVRYKLNDNEADILREYLYCNITLKEARRRSMGLSTVDRSTPDEPPESRC